MKIKKTNLPGVLLITPNVFGDERGFFQETFSAKRYSEAGIHNNFVQDNHSRSTKGVLRGLHFQLNNPQGKLVSVVRGEVFDVAVDIRVGSPDFGQWFGALLNDSNHNQMYVPPGFAHGFLVMSEEVDFVYKCTDYYVPDDEKGLEWNDPDIGIEWPISISPKLSQKDLHNPRLNSLVEQQTLPRYSQFNDKT